VLLQVQARGMNAHLRRKKCAGLLSSHGNHEALRSESFNLRAMNQGVTIALGSNPAWADHYKFSSNFR
jgi:hypothetical protein